MAGTISSLGLGSNLGLQNIMDQLRKADEAPLDTLKATQTVLKSQINAFDALNQGLMEAKASAMTLALDSTYIARSISSSDEKVLTASVSDGAVIGFRNIEVTRLATASSWEGASVASIDTKVNTSGTNQTFSYSLGGKTRSLTVANNTTLQGLADLINNETGNPGVTAKLVNDGSATPYKLVLTANNTGENNRIIISSQLSGYTLTEKNGAGGASLNASINVDGVTYQRQTNDGITDILNGITLNLKGTGTAGITVQQDNSKMTDALKGLVSKLNNVITSIKSQAGYDKDGKPNLLQGSGAVRTMGYDLINLLGTKVKTGGSIASLYDLGLEVNRDGTIALNETTLNKAIATHPAEVRLFLEGDSSKGINGLAQTINDRLRVMTRPITGTLASEQTAAQERISRIDAQIASTTARLDKKYDILAKQFSELDKFTNSMTLLSTYLTAQFKSLSGSSSSSN
ncbi:MAG: flagellar filament capping protein FliD [Dissulfuribacterales bacterium]